MEDLKLLAKNLQISNQVMFLGRVDNDKLPVLLNDSDFYVAIPETEGVSASLFEAMAGGCFPIVTDLPSNRAFIRPGQNGLLVPSGDAQKLADAIELFLASRSKFTEYVRENRAYIESEVDFNKNMEIIWSRYQQLLK